MIISEDSPLRHLPADLNRRQLLFLDGIRVAIGMADHAYARLSGTLYALSRKTVDDPSNSQEIVSAIVDAWSIIDSGHRLRELLQGLPNMRQKMPPLESFYRTTTSFRELRQIVQHLRGEIKDLETQGLPVWGTISWLTRSKGDTSRFCMYTAVPGTFYRGIHAHSMILDRHEPVPVGVSRVTLTVKTKPLLEVRLDTLLERVKPIVKLIEESLKKQFSGLPASQPDALVRITLHTAKGVKRKK